MSLSSADLGLDLHLMGLVQMFRGGEPVALGGPKQRGVLVILALAEGRTVSVSRLIDGIWGSEPPVDARGVIHTYVAQLRRVLGGQRSVLRTVGDGYSLELPCETLDFARLQVSAERGRSELQGGRFEAAREHFAHAIAECRGEPLADVADLAFARAAQTRLNEVAMNLREEAIELDLSLDATVQASAELVQLTAEQPYRERWWELLALAQYDLGRQAEALDTVSRARRLLRNELGIEPNARLGQIELAILRQEQTAGFLRYGRIGEARSHRLHVVNDPPVTGLSATVAPDRSAPPRGRLRNILTVSLALLAATAIAVALAARSEDPAAISLSEGAVGVVDPTSGNLLANIPIGRSIGGITADDDHVFVTDPSGRVLVMIDRARRQVTRSFALDGEPWRPSLAGRHVFVPIGDGQVARLDPTAGVVDQPITPLGPIPGRVVIIGVGSQTWAVARTGAVTVLEQGTTGPPPQTLPVTLARVSSDDRVGWAITDGTTVELVSFSPSVLLTRSTLRGQGVAIDVGPSGVWVVTSGDNRLWRADTTTGEVVATLALPSTPTDVAVDDQTVWISTIDGELLAIDATGQHITNTVNVGHRIVAIAHDDSNLWVGAA